MCWKLLIEHHKSINASTSWYVYLNASTRSLGSGDVERYGSGTEVTIGSSVRRMLGPRLERAAADRYRRMFVDLDALAMIIAGLGSFIEARRDLKVGICGEHGGEPSSVEFCYRVGMNYVSCSPYRVPIARLAAAQAALSGLKGETNRTA